MSETWATGDWDELCQRSKHRRLLQSKHNRQWPMSFLCLRHGPHGQSSFLLLRYSVLCAVESLSLLYLLFIPWCICYRRWCMDKLGVFNANQIFIVSWSTSELRMRLARRETSLSPPVTYFTDRSKAVLLLWIIYVMNVLCFDASASVYCCLVVNWWERADLLALLCDVYFDLFLLSHMVSWDRCGNSLYRFLILAAFLTFITLGPDWHSDICIYIRKYATKIF